jgi:hypothetical protein
MESVNECDDEFRSRVRTVGAPDSAISRFNVTKVCQARVGLKNAFEQIEVREDRLSKENLALRAEVERFSVFEEIVVLLPHSEQCFLSYPRSRPRIAPFYSQVKLAQAKS